MIPLASVMSRVQDILLFGTVEGFPYNPTFCVETFQLNHPYTSSLIFLRIK